MSQKKEKTGDISDTWYDNVDRFREQTALAKEGEEKLFGIIYLVLELHTVYRILMVQRSIRDVEMMPVYYQCIWNEENDNRYSSSHFI